MSTLRESRGSWQPFGHAERLERSKCQYIDCRRNATCTLYATEADADDWAGPAWFSCDDHADSLRDRKVIRRFSLKPRRR